MTKRTSPFSSYINKWVAYSRKGKDIKVIASASTIENLHRKIKDYPTGTLSVMNIPPTNFKFSL